MAEPRKLYRIEQPAAARLEAECDTAHAQLRHREIMGELRALRSALAAAAASEHSAVSRLVSSLDDGAGTNGGDGARSQRGDPGAQGSAGTAAGISRIRHELRAVVDGTEQAAQKILTAAEGIGLAVEKLAAALDGRTKQEITEDIGDFVIQIFEACSFQDLIGQRIAKVVAAMKFVEDHIAQVIEELRTTSAATQALHGPRLEGDEGHSRQADIDLIFMSRH